MNASKTDQLLAQIRTAAQQHRNGKRADALLSYEDLSQQAGDDLALNVELGHLCNGMGAFDRAIVHYKIAVDQQPENAHLLSFLGIAYQQDGQAEKAFQTLNRALDIDAGNAATLHGLGIYYMGRSDHVQARQFLERAQQLKLGDAGIRTNLATTLADLDEHEAALKHAEKALKLDSRDSNAHYAVGRILAEMGRTDEAIRHLQKTIRQHKTFGGAYDLYARVKKFTEADRAFIARTEKILQQGMPAQERCSLHYALGKMYDDCGEWDKAYQHFAKANTLQNRVFDLKAERKRFKQLKKVFHASSLEEYRQLGHPSRQPVFIVGMPRSGTTLMERIIAAHPRAAGASELPEIPRIASLISPPDDLRHLAAKTRANLSADNMREYAEGYLAVLRQSREGAERIVDKLPGNFLHLGLITSLFPNATVIHAIRHPLDVCLSCYFQNFTTISWTNDLELIGETYRFYREVMDYWHDVLPDGRIVDVEYEQLIEDPQTHGQHLLEGCGLEWDVSNLEFYRQAGAVRTASLWQVRQPVYKSSKKRWRNYAPHLQGLADTLSDFLEQDRQELEDCGIVPHAPSGIRRLNRLLGR